MVAFQFRSYKPWHRSYKVHSHRSMSSFTTLTHVLDLQLPLHDRDSLPPSHIKDKEREKDNREDKGMFMQCTGSDSDI